MRKPLFFILTFLIILTTLEFIGCFALEFSDFSTIRSKIIKQNVKHSEQLRGQAYLNTVNDNDSLVNIHKYRGEIINTKRTKKKRILFLGGSTTFGFGVKNYKETYPELLKKMLGDSIEIINGGLLWGTSAEILTHYLFKYQYYNPDMIVVNTGINDVGAYFTDNYQPDYNHWRGVIDDFPQHSQSVSFIMQSRLLSFFIIKLFFEDYIKGRVIVHDGRKMVQNWLTKRDSIALLQNAFYRNIKSLIGLSKIKKTEVILLSNYGNPFSELENSSFFKYYNYHEEILKLLAEEEEISFIKFPLEKLRNEDYWIDECHLTLEGNTIKANTVLPIIKSLISISNNEDKTNYEFSIPLEKSKNKGWEYLLHEN